ncbi:hypothetical protein HDU92_006940 [Lobulomyces angularis]|nr:hypothetical protein HDU92_006940 [Lobulomyces angularis]
MLFFKKSAVVTVTIMSLLFNFASPAISLKEECQKFKYEVSNNFPFCTIGEDCLSASCGLSMLGSMFSSYSIELGLEQCTGKFYAKTAGYPAAVFGPGNYSLGNDVYINTQGYVNVQGATTSKILIPIAVYHKATRFFSTTINVLAPPKTC